ncbi:hypothetical protein QCN36_gp86 [Arthrobacter phage CastorTray]|uniref:Uncharacterized protein n=1 Tax=Arthrobacter phage CastorTray TaxID=2859632 RepID=A0AAE7WDI8_9CAUD|nr:hypothetical protein QCN36_gp86 [Arthrobacter phage CastorTray]QYC55069.1 hypothetical protein SEA_CASTORTRAY_86 [Arthrobacter phage CastorTray]
MLPQAKVTLMVETFNGVDIIEIPLASAPEMSMGAEFDPESTTAPEQVFGFNCYALYDIDRNLVAHKETKPGVTMEWAILDMAREILRKRAEQ